MKAKRKQVTKYYRWGTHNFTVAGSPTISTDGIASGFSKTNYLVLPNTYKNSDNATYFLKFRTGTNITTTQYIQHAEYFFCWWIDEKSKVYGYNWGTQKAVNPHLSVKANTTYWFKINVNGTVVTLWSSTNGTSWTQRLQYTDTKLNAAHTGHQFRLGLSSYDSSSPFLGSFDLAGCYVEQGGGKLFMGRNSVSGSADNHDYTETGTACLVAKQSVTRYYKCHQLNAKIVGTLNRTYLTRVYGFSTSNYLQMNTSFNTTIGTQTWKIMGKFKLNTISKWNPIYGGVSGTYLLDLYVNASNHFAVQLSSNGSSYNLANVQGSYTVANNTDYWVSLEYTGSAYILKYSTDGVNFKTDITVSVATALEKTGDCLCLGFRAGNYLSGTLDLSQCYIDIGGMRWWNAADYQPHTSIDYDFARIKQGTFVAR